MKKQKLALALIVKNEEKNIRRLLESVLDHVDAVYLTDTGSTDNTVVEAEKVCKRFRVKLKVTYVSPTTHPEIYSIGTSRELYDVIKPNTPYEKWVKAIQAKQGNLFNFATARNFNFATVDKDMDWILWLDGDDTVEGAEHLRPLINSARGQRATGITLTYRYQVDKNGIDKTAHPKLRLVRNGMYDWTPLAPIHENLFIKDEFKQQAWEPLYPEIRVRHWKDTKGFEASGARNIKVLKALEEVEGNKPDPRTVFLIGRELHAQEMMTGEKALLDEAIKYLIKYTNMVPYGGEAMTAYSMLCEIHARRGDYYTVLKYAYAAVQAHPNHPAGYLMVGKAYSYLGDYNQTVNWVTQGTSKNVSELDSTTQTPKGFMRDASLMLCEAYYELKDHDKSIAALDKYIAIAEQEELEELDERREIIKADKVAKDALTSFTTLANIVGSDGKLHLVKPLIESVPDVIRHRKEVVTLKRQAGLYTKWQKNTVVIFCGGGFESWDESSLAKGLGGSETAVIEQAKRFGKAGYKVTVYNSVTETKVFGNVSYVPYTEVNWADHFDAFYSWRMPMLAAKFSVSANKKYLWMHDVPNAIEFNQETIDSYDKIILLSNFHKTFLPAVPDEKIYISSNGIDVETIEKIEKEGIVRNSKKIIYASSPDRGLENLLEVLVEVKKTIPDIESVWAYGWDNFDALRGHDPSALKWKAEMIEKMNKVGMKQLGRLGKEELYREYFSSGIWAYPTQFEEINCIVAQEAQACGCYPVTTGYAALEEVQKVGIRAGYPFDRENFTKELVNAVRSASYEKWDYLKLRKLFSWQRTADAWMTDLLNGTKVIDEKPLVSVVCVTIRPGMWRVLKETLMQQSYKNIELVVIDGRYHERAQEVAEYMKDFPYPFLHLPDPNRNTKKYPYGLFHADNAGLYATRGELVVFLQDFILMPVDGIQKYVDLYKTHPGMLYTGVDTRNGISTSKVIDLDADSTGNTEYIPQNLSRNIDVFEGRFYDPGEVQFTSPRIKVGGAKRFSSDPYEWELNYCAAPRKLLTDLGGWTTDWDSGFGYDNTNLTLRHLYKNGAVIVDETNKATALSHWDLFPKDSEGVPHRDKKPNDNRFASYYTYLMQKSEANQEVSVMGNLEEPSYSKDILIKLRTWLSQKKREKIK